MPDNLLTIPATAGRAIVQAGAVIACPLLGTDRFVTFCNERGLSIDRERLIRLERLGLFAPIFRVREPQEDVPPFYIPVRNGNDWFAKGWAWDTTGVPSTSEVPEHNDRTQEGYYSIFQLNYLHIVLSEMTLRTQLDSYLDRDEDKNIDWQKKGEYWMQHAESCLESLRVHEFRRSIALLCQHISNRYFPKTQGDQRTISVGSSSYSDNWISVIGSAWDWHEEARNWKPQVVEHLFDLTPEKLRHAYETLASAQSFCDPLDNWYQLIQFVSIQERGRLKGDALRAETFRAGSHMLRFLHKDLYGEELPHPNEVGRTIITPMPELEVRQDTRRYLEFVANRYGLNPQPKLSLFVEGKSEEAVILKILNEYFGIQIGAYGVEIITLHGVGTATGTKKEDRFRAILRLVDYLHHHQTFTFLVLDNENFAHKLKDEARKAKSKLSEQRYVTRPEYIRIWNDSFEFDNFSCSEIAMTLNELAQGRTSFSFADVMACKSSKNPGASLTRLYQQRANYDLPKVELNEILVKHMLSGKAGRKIENRPIVQVLERVLRLSARNPLPTMHEHWELNQASKYFGKKQKPTKPTRAQPT